MFNFKLHTIKDTSSKKPHLHYILFTVTFTTLISLAFGVIDDVGNIAIKTRFLYCFIVTIFGIFLPKYYISQNPSLKLYVSVYHHHPPPVLPWQLPDNFNPNSVELVCVQSIKE